MMPIFHARITFNGIRANQFLALLMTRPVLLKTNSTDTAVIGCVSKLFAITLRIGGLERLDRVRTLERNSNFVDLVCYYLGEVMIFSLSKY